MNDNKPNVWTDIEGGIFFRLLGAVLGVWFPVSFLGRKEEIAGQIGGIIGMIFIGPAMRLTVQKIRQMFWLDDDDSMIRLKVDEKVARKILNEFECPPIDFAEFRELDFNNRIDLLSTEILDSKYGLLVESRPVFAEFLGDVSLAAANFDVEISEVDSGKTQDDGETVRLRIRAGEQEFQNSEFDCRTNDLMDVIDTIRAIENHSGGLLQFRSLNVLNGSEDSGFVLLTDGRWKKLRRALGSTFDSFF